jgi:hypothetical protein
MATKKGAGLGLWCLSPLNNISVISWWSVLLLEETGVPGENHRPAANYSKTSTSRLERDSNSQL